jgi:hypothetical protein
MDYVNIESEPFIFGQVRTMMVVYVVISSFASADKCAFRLHIAKGFLVDRYAEMHETRREDLVEDVHGLSAGLSLLPPQTLPVTQLPVHP